jgi:capsular polysaccharide biosynthesis protein
MTEQPLDFRRVVAAIWRRRLPFFGCIGIALAGAAAYNLAAPPAYTARALVLLPASSLDSSGAPTRDVATQVRIASSTDVLDIAARALRPPPGLRELRKNVHVTATTPDILQFAAKASSRSRAIAIANRVAGSYVAYAVRGASAQVTRAVAPLKVQSSDLSKQVSDLQKLIDAGARVLASMPPGSATAADQTAQIDSLRAQQGAVVSQLLDVNRQISDVQVSSAVANSGTRLLERATTASNSALVVGARDAGIGLLLGALVGTVIVLALDGRDRRLRRRDDIASAAGVPTIASITTRVARSSQEWLALIARYEPSTDESWGLRSTLRHLMTAHDAVPAWAAVVCLAGDDDAVAVPVQLATFSARAGVRTVLLADRRVPKVSAVREVPRVTDAGHEPVLPNLWLVDAQSNAGSPDHLAPQLVIRVLVTEDGRLNGAAGAGAGAARACTTTLLAVSSGFATTEAVTSASLAATEAGLPLFGVIVANPRPDDDTSGRLPRVAGNARPGLPARVARSARGAR